MRIDRRAAGVALACLVLIGIVGGCGKTPLQMAASNIAKAQGVDDSAVRAALRTYASTEDDQLKIARQWEATLPEQPLPNLAQKAESFESVTDQARAALRSAACDAVVDMIATGQIPNAQKFVDGYLTAAVFNAVPYGELLEIGNEFEELYNDILAGEVSVLDIRLKIMNLQYCD